VVDDPPGVLRPEARVGQNLLAENDLARIRAHAAAVGDSNLDLFLDEVPVEPACVERRVDCRPSRVTPADKDVVAPTAFASPASTNAASRLIPVAAIPLIPQKAGAGSSRSKALVARVLHPPTGARPSQNGARAPGAPSNE